MLKRYFRYLRSAAFRAYQSDILKLVERNPGARVLDIGCDDGEWTNQLRICTGAGEIVGADMVAEALRKAAPKGVSPILCDVSSGFPFLDSTFDVVHANQVIEHLYRTEHFVQEVFRILKPGGYAIICTENLSSWHNIFALVLGWMPMSSSNFSQIVYNVGNPLALHTEESTYLPESWQHIRVLSLRGIKDIFKLHGFQVEEVLGAGYYPLPSFLAKLDPTHAAFLTCKFRKPKKNG